MIVVMEQKLRREVDNEENDDEVAGVVGGEEGRRG